MRGPVTPLSNGPRVCGNGCNSIICSKSVSYVRIAWHARATNYSQCNMPKWQMAGPPAQLLQPDTALPRNKAMQAVVKLVWQLPWRTNSDPKTGTNNMSTHSGCSLWWSSFWGYPATPKNGHHASPCFRCHKHNTIEHVAPLEQ